MENKSSDRKANKNDFDSNWYADYYNDVANSGLNPYDHYIRIGSKIGRKPSKNPVHYNKDIINEKNNNYKDENIHKLFYKTILDSFLFDSNFYLNTYPDIHSCNDPLMHYVIYGGKERRNPNQFFDSKW